MKSNQIEVGATYSAKVSGQIVPVRIESEAIGGGFWARNLQTSRTIRLRSARRLRKAQRRRLRGERRPPL